MPKEPLITSSFSLDSSGVAGFFGGDEAVSAMATVNLFEDRRWWGWYNSPGSYEIAKKYGQLAKSQLWDGLFPGPNVEPATLFGLDGTSGPAYTAACSGTTIAQTSHIAHLIMKHSKLKEAKEIKGYRTSTTYDVTIVRLHRSPADEERPARLTNRPYLAVIPIAASAAACIACVVYRDWYCAAMIFLGMFCSGISCFVIGSGTLLFRHPTPASGSPPGDGILMADTQVVVLQGEESAVNCVTRGRFSLEFKRILHPRELDNEFQGIGICSVFLTAQFLAQLLLIPQGNLFGQFMFLSTLAISWLYNLHLSSIDKEMVQRKLLINEILHDPAFVKYKLSSRTTAAVFSALVLNTPPESLETFLLSIIPNKTRVWNRWRASIVERITEHISLQYDKEDWTVDDLNNTEQELLKNLFQDAMTAQVAYLQYLHDMAPQNEKTRFAPSRSKAENQC